MSDPAKPIGEPLVAILRGRPSASWRFRPLKRRASLRASATKSGLMRPSELTTPQRRWAMSTMMIVAFMAVLDGTIANIALPTIARELAITPAASIWIINAFQIAVTATLVALASLGGLVGYARVYRIGAIVFTVGSLFCALSHVLSLLIVAR